MIISGGNSERSNAKTSNVYTRNQNQSVVFESEKLKKSRDLFLYIVIQRYNP